ncbi:MAG: tryptophan-rich sensory protein [Bacteroidota bacterium]|nr:tryptophan-rich sensory protein [Bacteroidota bacterium]
MNYSVLVQTLLFCLIFIVIEAFTVSKKGKQWFQSLKQPRFALPFSVWYFIGGLYYLICGTIAYRLFQNKESSYFSLTLCLLILMMIGNALPNLFLFKQQSLKKFYWSGIPFSIILAALYFQLLRVDTFSSWVLFPYFLWLFYDFYYFHSLIKLNND